jgi:iron complex outermembrane receptor protein
MKFLFLSLFFLLSIQNLWCQITKDSVSKEYQLEEVCVCDKTNDDNPSFGFYRSNKLASTEDILARMQGVNLIKRGAYGLEPTLRGFGSGQTNLMIDGMRMYGACTDKMDPVSIYIEPINLKSIQVKHGATGAIEGSTIGGHIGMKLNEPTFDCHSQLKGQITQSYLTVNNGFNSSASFYQSFKKLAYRVSGTFRIADNYKAGSNNLVPFSGYQKTNTSASIIYKLNKTQQIKFDYLGDWGKNIGFPALPMDVGKASANILAITHRFIFKPKKFFTENELKVYANSITHYMDDTRRPNVPIHMDMPGWSKTIGFYNNLSGNKDLNLRMDFHRAYTRADMTMYPNMEAIMYMQTLPENNLNDLGLAISKKINLPLKQQVSINGRLDYFTQSAISGPGSQQWNVFNTDVTKTKSNILKNINLSYINNFIKQTHVQLNIGYGERITTSNERYGYYLYNRQDQYDYIGNLKLKPEKSFQTELIFKQEFKTIEYSFNLFYHQINNYIYAYKMVGFNQMTIGASGLKTYKNIDFAISTGFEGSLALTLPKGLNYLGTLKFVYSQTNTGEPLPLIPPFKLQQALRYKIKQYQFQLEHDFAAKQNRVNLDYGDRVTSAFNLFNIRGSKNFSFNTSLLQVAIGCENILDTNYREHLDIGNIPRFGRNFLINVSYIF